MAGDENCGKKRIGKARGRNLSTSSATTATPGGGNSVKGMENRAPGPAQIEQVFELLRRGASVLLACREAGVSEEWWLRELRRDAVMAARQREVQELLAGNVSAALYRQALEGHVTAQTNWLKLAATTAKATTEEGMSDDDLQRLERAAADDCAAAAACVVADEEGE